MSDLISRQAAIDIIEDFPHGDVWNVESMEEMVYRIKLLPSAQPEVIKCKDCKHWMPYEWMFNEVWQSQNIDDYPEDEISCNYCDVHMKSSDFCSQAVRREVQDENDKTTNNTTNA